MTNTRKFTDDELFELRQLVRRQVEAQEELVDSIAGDPDIRLALGPGALERERARLKELLALRRAVR